jgi:hypothetical protein
MPGGCYDRVEISRTTSRTSRSSWRFRAEFRNPGLGRLLKPSDREYEDGEVIILRGDRDTWLLSAVWKIRISKENLAIGIIDKGEIFAR